MKKTIRVAGSILTHNDKVLLLLRSAEETDPSLWGIPAGKVEQDETDLQAAEREILEETGIKVGADNLAYLGALTIEYEAITVNFPIFHASFENAPEVVLDGKEHVEFRWLTPSEILALPNLMKDVDTIVQEFCVEKLGINS